MPKNTQSKSAFILQFPSDKPAAEVVAEGKKAGIKFTAAYVYVARNEHRKKAARAAVKPAAEPVESGDSFRSIQEYVARVGTEQALKQVQAVIQDVNSHLGL